MVDRTVVYRLQADSRQLKTEMAAASTSVRNAGVQMEGANAKGKKFSAGLDGLGVSAGLVAAGGIAAVVGKAADFDQAMSNVQAATHESTEAMSQLREAAMQAGAETAFSATEAAAGIENLAKAGVDTAEILDGGLSGALALAAAGGMDVASAAEAAAGAMAQFKLEGDQVPHIADLLAAAAGKAQGEVSDMVMALKQGGTVAAQTGLTLEETTGTLAALAEQSLLGSDAGTSFKTMLASLTPNSDKARKAMEQYNIQAFDAQGNFVGMTELAGQLERGLGGLTDEQRAMALETIFGSDAVRAASIIYDNGADGIAKWTAQVNDAGYAAETAAIKQDNLRGDLEKLGGAFETSLIGSGESSQTSLRTTTQLLTQLVDVLNEAQNGGSAFSEGVRGATDQLSVLNSTAGQMGLTNLKTLFSDSLSPAEKFKAVLFGVDEAAEGAAGAGDLWAMAANGLTGAQTKAADGAIELKEAARLSAEEIKAQAEALQDAREAATKTASSFFNLGDSLSDAKVSLGDWISQMANQADALNNFTSNARKAADNGLRKGLIAALKEAGPEGALRMKQLANATEGEIDRANAAWRKGQDAINKYVGATVKVPKSVSTNIDVNALPAFATFRQVDQYMSALDGKRAVTYIDTVTRRLGQTPETRAEGGYIAGPGTATSDSIPAYLSNGEYVIKAAAVNHYGTGMFDRLNAMHFASGGSVGSAAERLEVLNAEKAIRELLKSLKADGKNKLGPNAREIAELELKVANAQLEAAKADLGKTVRDKSNEALASSAKDMSIAAEAQRSTAESLLESSKSLLESTIAQRDSFAASVSGNFDNNIFGNGLSGAMLQLGADTNDANSFNALLQSLSGIGLDGDAFKALAASGDINTASQLFAGGAGSVDSFESSYAARAQAQRSVGAFAGEQVFGAQIAAQTAAVQQQQAALHAATEATNRMEKRLAQIEANIAAGVAAGAEAGTRAGNNDRNQDTRQRERAGGR